MIKPSKNFNQLIALFSDLKCNRIPGQLVIQLTDRCNAFCPQCGMSVTKKFKRSTLSADNVKRIIDAAAQKGVNVVSFTGGEPFLFLDQLVMFIKYAGEAGIDYIRTGTNGFMFADPGSAHFESRVKKVAETLAGTPLRNFWISIDSAVPSVHEQMRGLPDVIAGIEKALPIFHEQGIYPSANLGINRNVGGDMTKGLRVNATIEDDDHLGSFCIAFKKAFREFYCFVIKLGFTMVNSCYPMSIDHKGKDDFGLRPVYAANSNSSIVSFSAVEKALLFKALLETTTEFRHQIRLFSPRSSLYALYRQYVYDTNVGYPCRGGIDFFFIDSKDGNTYPCGYRGNENFGRYWDMDMNARDRIVNDCRLCDWECFRDPSELFGPILNAFHRPVDLMKKFFRDTKYFKLWFDDIRYYLACDFFNGRLPPDFNRMGMSGKNPALQGAEQ